MARSTFLVCAILVATLGAAHAQTVIDDSPKNITETQLKDLITALGRELRDPISAQIRNLRHSQIKGVCGELNSKNAYGGYVGFVRMYHDADQQMLFIAQQGVGRDVDRVAGDIAAMMNNLQCPARK